MPAQLTDPWQLGPLTVPNRVMLAPLAGIGNWFVRLQAKRYGAGMAVSEMVSSHAIFHGNERTCVEMLRIDPRERADGRATGIVDPAVRPGPRRDARRRARRGARRAPTRSTSTWAVRCRRCARPASGAALLDDPDAAVARRARGAREAAGCPSPSSCAPVGAPARTSGFELAHRLVDEAGVAAIAFHPALGGRASQRRPRLRAGGAAGAHTRCARDPHRRPARRRGARSPPSSTPAPPR